MAKHGSFGLNQVLRKTRCKASITHVRHSDIPVVLYCAFIIKKLHSLTRLSSDKMGPALDLGLNLVIFFALLSMAVCIFSVPGSDEKASKASSHRKRLADLGDEQESPLEQGQRCFGTVQRYSERNGIGFIACAPCRAVYGRDVQLFQEDWEALQLTVGSAVSFLLSVEERFPCPKGRPWAADVQRVR